MLRLQGSRIWASGVADSGIRVAGVDTSTCLSSDYPVNVGLADGRLSFISCFV